MRHALQILAAERLKMQLKHVFCHSQYFPPPSFSLLFFCCHLSFAKNKTLCSLLLFQMHFFFFFCKRLRFAGIKCNRNLKVINIEIKWVIYMLIKKGSEKKGVYEYELNFWRRNVARRVIKDGIGKKYARDGIVKRRMNQTERERRTRSNIWLREQ